MYKDFKHIIHIVNKFIFNEKAIQFSIRQTLNAFAQNLRKNGQTANALHGISVTYRCA